MVCVCEYLFVVLVAITLPPGTWRQSPSNARKLGWHLSRSKAIRKNSKRLNRLMTAVLRTSSVRTGPWWDPRTKAILEKIEVEKSWMWVTLFRRWKSKATTDSQIWAAQGLFEYTMPRLSIVANFSWTTDSLAGSWWSARANTEGYSTHPVIHHSVWENRDSQWEKPGKQTLKSVSWSYKISMPQSGHHPHRYSRQESRGQWNLEILLKITFKNSKSLDRWKQNVKTWRVGQDFCTVVYILTCHIHLFWQHWFLPP